MIESTLRRIVIPVIIIVGLALVAPVAASAGSNRIPLTYPDMTFTGFCPFSVLFHVVKTNEYYTPSMEPDGTVIWNIQGNSVSAMTNVDTGKMVEYNFSGPATITFFPDGGQAVNNRGPGGTNWGPQAQSAYGVPPIMASWGHLQYTTDPSGNVTSYSLSGHAEDVCAALS
jgi:hypothetical protein